MPVSDPATYDGGAMTPDPAVIRAIESAVSADPGNAALRVHLAGLLMDAGQPRAALVHLEAVLRAEPDHPEALGLAARVGRTLDDPRASGWARLFASLTGHEAPPAAARADLPASPGVTARGATSPGDPPLDGTDAAATEEGADWDKFLREVLSDAGYLAGVTLADVGGLVDVKERLERSFLTPLRNPELRRTYGTHLRGGLLLWGPPGCGKTFLARAVAGEMGAQFVAIGLDRVLDMWLGSSEKQLHELFEWARRTTPCVLFFDELDAIGHSRINLGRSAARNVVAQLLVELDGVDTSNEGIFVIGATNQPWDVDPALRRPGRFDRTMLVLPPDVPARAAILRYHLRGRPVGDIDVDALARASEGMSGADLGLACDEAAELGAGGRHRQLDGPAHPDRADPQALSGIRPSTTPWLESAKNHVRYANASGEYDELASYLRQRRPR